VSTELRGLPRVDRVTAHPSLDDARRSLGMDAVTRLARRAIEEAREEARRGALIPTADEIALRAAEAARQLLASRAQRVINATGVVLHTNLGRAPLGERAIQALAASAGGYTSIEIDLETGRRGRRGAFVEDALSELTGAEAALVVNNNAAAVLLMLSALAAGKPVIVSRGELIEIGGGFRVPEVMERSTARLVEVGTTNRTRASDFARALDTHPEAVAVLRVHQGNFRQVGFVERPDHRALAELCHARNVLLLEDLGGGALVDLTPHGLSEPTARESIAAGSDVVCFSTDKVLGGPQGGVLAGRAPLIERCRRDPLARALRLGKLPLVALEATLSVYLEGDLDSVPVLAAVRAKPSALQDRATGWRDELVRRGVSAEVIELSGAVGGGACAEEPLPSWGVSIQGNEAVIAERLRAGEPRVLARVSGGLVLLDARTVLPGEDAALLAAVTRAAL
jgi:L-seryl-tRNA(Ser) seleniumtransferase